ncbi:MAG: sugar ABC transporter permease [Hyphomicrobiales bacterium]|nr:sugar ABC transporter permease [Hyphomicrobiales bacterium]
MEARTSSFHLTQEEHRRRRSWAAARHNLTAYAFLAPILVFFIAFLALPVVWLLYLSFQHDGILAPARFAGLDNWRRAFSDGLVLKCIGNTLYYCVLAIPTVFVLGMIVALSLQTVRRGAALLRILIYFPTLQASLIVALIWTFMVHPDFGLLNLGIRALSGAKINFLGDPHSAMPTIAMIEVWKGLGFWVILFLSGLLALPADLYHAAELDGAGAIRRFFSLTLPLMRPTFYFGVIFATIVNLQLFDSVFVLTDGGPVNSTATIAWYIYRSLFTFSDPGFGATLSFVLVIVVVALTALQTWLMRERAR